MPPKKKGSNNTRKNLSKFNDEPFAHNAPEYNLEYAKITKTLGDCRFLCLISTQQELVGRISGKIKKRSRINPGDIVLVSKRDFETGITRNEKLDILHKYNEDTARKLLRWGELDFIKTTSEVIDDTFVFANDDDEINFDDI